MSTSVRTYLVAGAAAATATAIALTPVQAAPADIAVPAQPTSAQPQLTQAMIDLLAAASRMTAAVAPRISDQTGDPPAEVAPAAAVTGDVGVQNAASDWLTSGYQFIQYWVDYGVELAEWVVDWIPYGYLIGDQINIFYWDLIRPIADGYFYGWLVPVVNDPLNLNVWWDGFVNTVDAAVNAGINFGIAEFNYFFGWILPPLPPLPGLATTQTLAASQSLFPNLRNVIGDVVLPPADFVTDAAVNTINGAYDVVHNAANFVVDGADDVLDALRLDFVSRQLDINYDLISALSAQGVGLTTDLIQVPDRYLNDVLANGEGLLEALGTEARFVGNSLTTHGNAALNAVGNYVEDQINYFTPGVAATESGPTTTEVAKVPTSVRASLQETVDSTAEQTEPSQKPASTVTNGSRAVRAGEVQARVQERIQSAVDGAKKAGDDAREAAKTVVNNLTPKAKDKDKATPVSSKDSTDSKSSTDPKPSKAKPTKDKQSKDDGGSDKSGSDKK
ncbi:hypothetical protein [Mycolicibacterium sp. HK-90]|uniref:hypothetical protein n=1 Tax=Mycolicibacterium sp. HK-90 TaxID=3056937 RepID=UPI00265AEF09|nr:hypothetical protein [Mycolicibacterium sp. HK-90]WKG02094.1 hypothetical protein QU592_23115 [Mycolicibacterium sp. HK-90]